MSVVVPLKRPVHDHFSITIEPGQEEMFLALREIANLRTGFTAGDLARVSGGSTTSADYYLARLVRAGIALVAGSTTDRQILYAITRLPSSVVVLNTRSQPDRWFTLRQAVWKAIRIRKEFTVRLLWDDVRPTIADARLREVSGIVGFLRAAGYLESLFGDTPRGEEQLRLRRLMDTGPLPPRLCEATLAYDLNTRTFYGVALAREVFHVA